MESIIHSQEASESVEESAGMTIVPSGVTSSGVTREVAYTITDTSFPPFKVYKAVSSNGEDFGRPAWWSDRSKVERLITAFKAGHMIKDACFYAGISRFQWETFNELHPDFSSVKEACESYPRFAAMDSVNKAMPNDPKLSLQYLRLRHPEFKSKVQVESDQPLAPTVNVSVSNDVDTTEIKAILAQGVQRLLSERDASIGAGTESGGGPVEGHHPPTGT